MSGDYSSSLRLNEQKIAGGSELPSSQVSEFEMVDPNAHFLMKASVITTQEASNYNEGTGEEMNTMLSDSEKKTTTDQSSHVGLPSGDTLRREKTKIRNIIGEAEHEMDLDDKQRVNLRFWIESVSDIDTVGQTFNANFVFRYCNFNIEFFFFNNTWKDTRFLFQRKQKKKHRQSFNLLSKRNKQTKNKQTKLSDLC